LGSSRAAASMLLYDAPPHHILTTCAHAQVNPGVFQPCVVPHDRVREKGGGERGEGGGARDKASHERRELQSARAIPGARAPTLRQTSRFARPPPPPETRTGHPDRVPRRRTVILEVVSVPVLSEQMVVAPPMVSHALRCRTCRAQSPVSAAPAAEPPAAEPPRRRPRMTHKVLVLEHLLHREGEGNGDGKRKSCGVGGGVKNPRGPGPKGRQPRKARANAAHPRERRRRRW
jgi:hypothetical protein